jgi:hypothetical protein
MILILAAKNYSIFKVHNIYTFSRDSTDLMGLCLLTEVSSSYSVTPHSAGLFRTSDRPYAILYLTTHDTLKRQTYMLSAGFEPVIPARERPQTHGLDRAATGIGISIIQISWKYICKNLRTHRLTLHTATVHVHHKNLLAFRKRKETKKRKIKGDVEREKCRQWGWRMTHRSYESLPGYTASHPTRP